ncbi:MAG: DUF6807 family protein [Pirellulaceae bacterium]
MAAKTGRHPTCALPSVGRTLRPGGLTCITLLSALVCGAALAQTQDISFERRADDVVVRIRDRPVATYVLRDAQVSRPYFAHICTPSGIQVSRHHPPRPGTDATDHVGLHAGIWMSFGDVSGEDYWRMKSRTEHVCFVAEPRLVDGVGEFTVLNRYRSSGDGPAIAEETCRLSVVSLSIGYRLEWRSQFTPLGDQLVFGDQEEMGLGVRMATPLAVDRKQGGRMLDDQGRRNESQIWGRTVDWIDCAGPLQGSNPFGRHAFTGQDESRLVVRRGDVFTLTYGIVVHESKTESDVDIAGLYRDFVAARPSRP